MGFHSGSTCDLARTQDGEPLPDSTTTGTALGRQPLVQILERQVAMLKDKHEYKKLRRYLGYELRSARRQLKAAKLAEMSSWAAPVFGSSLRKLEQYRRALFIRSPWFPKMKVRSVSNPIN